MEKLGAGDPPRIGGYRLLGRLGAGGMGTVYLARSDRGRTVAVKLVRGELAEREEFRARFRQEVRAARRVGGHWTAPVLDADTEAPVPWVATGYVAGTSLQQIVEHDHGPLPERSVRVLGAGLAQALMDIHAAGIVHRDLKPSNILVTIDGPRVIDFGIARALETSTDAGLTRAGALIGSPGFMAPEQVRGDRTTPACDVFCLGSVLVFAATGQLPFGSTRSGAHAVMFRIAQEEPDLTGVPESLADLVRACLRKDPASRPPLHRVLERTGAEDTVVGGRLREPWLPGALVAQLGRSAVRLLDTEAPEETPGSAAAEAPDARGVSARPGGEATPEHGAAADSAPDTGPAAPEPAPPTPGGTPARPPHLPHLSHGVPHQHPQQPGGPGPDTPANGAVTPSGGPATVTPSHDLPPYAPSPYAPSPYEPSPYEPDYDGPLTVGPPAEPSPRRDGRSTAALLAVAVVVAIGAGGSMYALLSGGDKTGDDDPGPSPSVSAPASTGPSAPGAPGTAGTSQPSGSGAVPSGYLGTWTATITNADGENTRTLTLTQGGVGDTVLSLVAEGPTANGSYRCVFDAVLSRRPDASGPLEIGPSTLRSGRSGACSPGAATRIRLLPDGTLERVNTDSGESLAYTRR